MADSKSNPAKANDVTDRRIKARQLNAENARKARGGRDLTSDESAAIRIIHLAAGQLDNAVRRIENGHGVFDDFIAECLTVIQIYHKWPAKQ